MDLDTFRGNKGGKGKGGKGKEKYHNPDKDVVCHAKENGGTGKPPEPKDPKAGAKGTKGKKGGKGKGGKGKGKAHSFEGEGEEEQEWPEGDGQDGEQAGDGDLGFLCVLGPSADSAPGPPPAAPGQICRPAFGPVSWTWSQAWKVALAECQVGVKDGAPNYWCPCPGCKGQKKRLALARATRLAGLPPTTHCGRASSFSAKGKTFSFLPAPGWSKRRAQVS